MSGLMNLMEVNLTAILLIYLKAVPTITRPVHIQNSSPVHHMKKLCRETLKCDASAHANVQVTTLIAPCTFVQGS